MKGLGWSRVVETSFLLNTGDVLQRDVELLSYRGFRDALVDGEMVHAEMLLLMLLFGQGEDYRGVILWLLEIEILE